jgi:hypothetical protein
MGPTSAVKTLVKMQAMGLKDLLASVPTSQDTDKGISQQGSGNQ